MSGAITTRCSNSVDPTRTGVNSLFELSVFMDLGSPRLLLPRRRAFLKRCTRTSPQTVLFPDMPMLTGHRATFAQPLVATSKSPYLMQESAPGSISGRYSVGLRAMLSVYERANGRAATFVISLRSPRPRASPSGKGRCTLRSLLRAVGPPS